MTAQVAAEARAGLTSLQAREALAAHGPNEIAPARRRRAADLVVEALREPMFILLAVAAGAYLVLGDLFEGVALSIGAVLAVALVIFQQFRSERALAAPRELAQPHAHVIRDGEMTGFRRGRSSPATSSSSAKASGFPPTPNWWRGWSAWTSPSSPARPPRSSTGPATAACWREPSQ